MRIDRPLARHMSDPVLARWVPFVAVVDGLLAPDECDALVARIETEGPEPATIKRGSYQELAPSIRDNDRALFDDAALARALFERLGPAVPPSWEGAAAVGLNERFRGYRYAPGQRLAAGSTCCAATSCTLSPTRSPRNRSDSRASSRTASRA